MIYVFKFIVGAWGEHVVHSFDIILSYLYLDGLDELQYKGESTRENALAFHHTGFDLELYLS